MALIVTDDKHYKNIAAKIRSKAKTTYGYTSEEMSKLGIDEVYESGFKEGEEGGYNSGKADGYNEGYEAHLKWFWDGMLNNGNAANYINRFRRWTNTEIYQPNHNIVHSLSAAASATETFREAFFTDLKVDNIFNDVSRLNYFCQDCTSLVNARTFYVTEKTTYYSPFGNCPKLKEIRFEGTIGKNGLSFSSSPLSLESAISVITHLKDFSGTSSAYTCSIQFSETTWGYLNADGTNSPNGTTWAEYIDNLGWNC